MKTIFSFLLVLFSAINFAQTEGNPAVWDAEIKKISDTEFDVIFKAKILKDWHLYSQYNPDNASQPIEISQPDSIPKYKIIGKAKESETFKEYTEIWEKEEIFFKNNATLTQRIQIIDQNTSTIKIVLTGQVCKEACLPIEEPFTLSLKGETINEVVTVDKRSQELSKKLQLDLKNTQLLKGNSNSNTKEGGSLTTIFLLGFFGGLLALLTPCVFPMIPLTVSFFTKQSQNKSKGITNAILYGLFIVLIYFLLSLPFHLIDGLDPSILNNISTNVWLNVFFFVVLAFFAFSFFGFYEITLPSSWGNKMDNASNIGGIVGIFFMALTLAIVSFSCTGPILGSLLAGSLNASGDTAMQLSTGMIGFGLALALPFALFALFPSWLNSLPKSGGWLNTTKVVLGFLELAFAFKFLSNADLVGHWGFLKREIFIGLWIILFIGLALYLFGKIKFPHDGELKKLSFSRISLGVLVGAFIIYLIPGLMKEPSWTLNQLSGFPPPQFYSVYEKENNCPLGLNCFKDFDEGLAYAKQNQKPILLDFTGWACVNCRKMEENVWSQPQIYKILKEEYVLISLYVDDNEKELPKEQQFDFLRANGKIKKIKTVGDKWATFQVINFKSASQPYYILLSPNLKVLHRPEKYTDKDTYYKWLKEGLNSFK